LTSAAALLDDLFEHPVVLLASAGFDKEAAPDEKVCCGRSGQNNFV
jgi:hypothetical protein